MAQAAKISLKIKCLKSDDFDLQIDSEASVDDLKEEIVKIRDIEAAKQRLIYKGRVLKSNKKLKDYSISDKTTVHLIVRRQAVTNPRNDEVNEHNSTITNNNNNTSIPTGTTAISVAVVDGSNGAADVNSILNSVLSGISSGNLNQQSVQDQIQSAMANNPSHVMNLRGLLNPGDNPNAPNDDDVSSIDGDDSNTNDRSNNNTLNRILPELQPQFAVSNGRGGYSPVTLLPPVLRSCHAINLELDRLQRNYNREVMGIRSASDDNDANERKANDASGMNIDSQNNTNDVNMNRARAVDVDVEVESVQTIVADSNGTILSNNTSAANDNAQNNNANAADVAPPTAAAADTRPRRREYLSHLLDVWDRFNEVVNGQNSALEDMNAMDEDQELEDDDMEMKGNNKNNDNVEYEGVIGFVESVFDELIDFQNTIETGLNNEDVKDEKDEKDDDNDMEMSGTCDDMKANNETLKSYSTQSKEQLAKKVKCSGNMLVEIGTVLASLGHMINKMDLQRKTPRNRLRITGLSGVSHVVRTAVPVEISTIVSRGINMQQFQQMHNLRQIANAQQQQRQQSTQAPAANQANGDNVNDANASASSQPQADENTTSNNTNTAASDAIATQNNDNDDTTNGNNANANAAPGNLLSSILDTFASGRTQTNDNSTMDLDETEETNTNTSNTSTTSIANNNNNNNNNNSNNNPMSALLNAFTGSGSGANPLASLMSAFGGGAAGNNNRNNNSNNTNSNTSNPQTRNPLMLIQNTLIFLMETLSMTELECARNEKYSFIGDSRNEMRAFIFKHALISNDTPMKRHETAMDYANGFGLFMISRFSSEQRDEIRSLTVSHFRNHTPTLIDIIMDSNSESVFEERLVEWIASVFSSWIYKLSLKFSSRLEGVKKLFCQILLNATKYLNSTNITNLSLIPQYVSFFVDKAKAYHLKEMQKQHASQQQTSSSSADSASSSFTNRRNNSNEQWVMNVEEAQRNRWLDTIRCDQKRMKQCLNDMKHHEFSQSYAAPQRGAEEKCKK